MDAKDLRTEAALGDRSTDGNTKYMQSGGALPCHRNKTYQDIGSNPLGKADVSASRPCAVIGPDRVLPPPASAEAYLKKGPTEPWLENTYRRPPDYPQKILDYQHPTRNISPRQTFQENMQRIMVPPSYNVMKVKDGQNFSGDASIQTQQKINKVNVATDSNSKYCDVPYSVNPMTNEQKNARNQEISATNINSVRSTPHGWPPPCANVRPSKAYPQELYQYPDYPSCVGPRPMLMTRTHRTLHEDPGPVYPDGYHHDGSLRFKPYPPVKERYPQSRYEFVTNYANPFHPQPPFPYHKYDMQKPGLPHPYPGYPQVPVKYLDRMPEPIMNGYQRPLSQQPNYNNIPFRGQVVHPNYGPIPGNCIQTNKLYSYPPDNSKSMSSNKIPYDANGKMYQEYESIRNKGFPIPEGFYINEIGRPQPMKGKVLPPNYPTNIHPMPTHPYYRKDNLQMRGYDYSPHFRNMDSILNGNTIHRFPPQFSPSAIAISPSDSNTSNDTNQTHGTSQEDCGYVSQSSSASIRSVDSGANRIPSEMYRRYEHRYSPLVRTSPVTRHDVNLSSNIGTKHKKEIDVRQFLTMWNEGEDDNGENNNKEAAIKPISHNTNDNVKNHEPSNHELYVLGLVNVPREELGKYEHIQKVSKLPENIKGYNSIELLHQFEEVIESSNLNNFSLKPPPSRDFYSPLKGAMSLHGISIPSRPLSPLDVEAKISQSVIHKEVGCNFEIKPCSPKMLNVDAAAPLQTVYGERVIEKVSNPLIIHSPILHDVNKTIDNCNLVKSQDRITESPNVASCKMINTQYSGNGPVDTIKNNYSLQDLESNSGVCLASLPRLDNDIELNFPEVNQQFINANKAESVITATPLKDLPTLNIEHVSNNQDSLETEKLKSKSNVEKDLSKLSKYRKIKKKTIGPESNVQALRKDSVIIKNPDNNKSYDIIMELSPKNESEEVQNNPINLSVTMEHRDHTDESNFPTAESTNTKRHEFAIDFSLNSNSKTLCELKVKNESTENLMSEKIELNIDCQMTKVDTAETENKTIEFKNNNRASDSDKEIPFDSNNICERESDVTCENTTSADILNNIYMSETENVLSCDDTSNAKSNKLNHEDAQKHNSMNDDFVDSNIDKTSGAFVQSGHQNEFESTFSLSRKSQVKDSLISGNSKETDMFLEKAFAHVNRDVTMDDMNSKELDADLEYKNNESNDSFSKIEVVCTPETFSDNDSFVVSPISKEDELNVQTIYKQNILETCDTDDSQKKQNQFFYESNEYENERIKRNLVFYHSKEHSSIFELKKEIYSPWIQKLLMHVEGKCHVTKSTINILEEASIVILETPEFLDKFDKSSRCNLKDQFTDDCKESTLDSVEKTTVSVLKTLRSDERISNLKNNDHLSSINVKTDEQIDEITMIDQVIEKPSMIEYKDVPCDQAEDKISDYDVVAQSGQDSFNSIANLQDADIQSIGHKSTEKQECIDNLGESPLSTDSNTLQQNAFETLLPSTSPSGVFDPTLQEKTALKQSIALSLSEMHSELVKMNITGNLSSPISDLSDDDSDENVESVNVEPGFCSTTMLETTKGERVGSCRLSELICSPIQKLEPDSTADDMHLDEQFLSNNKYGGSQEEKETGTKSEKDSFIKIITEDSRELNSTEIGKSDTLCANRNDSTDIVQECEPTHRENTEVENFSVSSPVIQPIFCSNKSVNNLNDNCNDSDSSNIDSIISNNSVNNQLSSQENIFENNIDLHDVKLNEDSGLEDSSKMAQNSSVKDYTNGLIEFEQINKSDPARDSIISVTPQRKTEYDQIEAIEEIEQLNITRDAYYNFTQKQTSLKRSFSDSALNSIRDHSENSEWQWPYKRRRVIESENNNQSHLVSENIGNIVQNFRRNSISAINNGENVSFCILIDNDCIITEEDDETEKLCFTEVPEECLSCIPDDTANSEDNSATEIVSFQEELNRSNEYAPFAVNFPQENNAVEDPWVEDIACVETVVTDDIAENIVISASTSPKDGDLSEGECDDDSTEIYNVNEHTEKLKYIYGDKMCSDDSHFVETLYRTPQMNVDKTLYLRESHLNDDFRYYDKESLEKVLSESNIHDESTSNSKDYEFTSSPRKPTPATCDPNNKENLVQKISSCPLELTKLEENAKKDEEVLEIKTKDSSLSESSLDEHFTFQSSEDSPKYNISSSPEVSSTTSEEKNVGIYLKITNLGGSRVSQVKNTNYGNSICCKYTEKKDYLSSNNHLPTRTLLTKAAQKYIPPLKETIPDLKVKLSLPQDSLVKLKQLKVAKETPKPDVNKPNNKIYIRKEVPKKSKPKFEDVLMSIDEIQFQKHREKTKKIRKSIPKVVIKKTENGSHYASTSNEDKFNPDLTGRKWQPWVFLEKNNFIDKMALKRKTRAIFSHRKKTYVLAEKFQTYKAVGSTKFIISQPKFKDSSPGQLKYTIKLKHNY